MPDSPRRRSKLSPVIWVLPIVPRLPMPVLGLQTITEQQTQDMMLMCDDSINIAEYREKILLQIAASPNNLESMVELVCANCLICEENVGEICSSWRNTPFINEILEYAPLLLNDGRKRYHNIVFNVCERINDILYNHPRQSLKVLEVQLIALEGTKEKKEDKERLRKEIENEMCFLDKNIKAADSGHADRCENRGSIKRDSVEWTAEYENAIDEAEEKASDRLAGFPRVMGFCHAYWHSLANILFEDYGIVWRSPAMMNPGVIFD